MKPIFGLLFVVSCGAAQLCPPSWNTFQGKCYYYSGSHAVHWDSVAHECRSLNPAASPVSIHSQAENDYLLSLMHGNFAAIGLFRTGNTVNGLTNWEWMDGTELDFTKWTTPPTDNAYCGLLRYQESGDWAYDFHCVDPSPFFCQIEL